MAVTHVVRRSVVTQPAGAEKGVFFFFFFFSGASAVAPGDAHCVSGVSVALKYHSLCSSNISRAWEKEYVVHLAVALVLFAVSTQLAYEVRLFAIRTFGKVIHEFDPW